MFSVSVALWLQAVAASPAPLLPATPAPEVVTTPDWMRRPSGADVSRVYPRGAMAKDLSGRASISCQVDTVGTLVDCVVTEEYPRDEGFGQAALQLAPYFKMRPMTRGGQPVGGGTVRIPLRFTVEGRTDALTGMLNCYGSTAAALGSDPANAELIGAFAAFTAQVAVREMQARATPETFERALAGARMSAIANAGTPGAKTTLKACLGIIRKPAA